MLIGLLPTSIFAVGDTQTETSVAKFIPDNGNPEYCDTIDQAFDYASLESSPKIVLLKNCDAGNNRLNVSSSNLTLDLAGYTLSGTYEDDLGYYGFISVWGSREGGPAKLTILDSSAAKTGKITNKVDYYETPTIHVDCNYSTLVIESGTIENAKRGSKNENRKDTVIYLGQDAKFTMTGGTISGKSSYGIFSQQGIVDISGDAKIKGLYRGLGFNYINASITGGEFSGNTSGIFAKNPAENVNKVLAGGYSFADESGSPLKYAANATSTDPFVKVVKSNVPVSYIDKDGNAAQCEDYVLVTDNTTCDFGEEGKETWYVINGSIKFTDDGLNTSGTVNFILSDGADVSAAWDINFDPDGGELNIYGQTAGTGKFSLDTTAPIPSIKGNSDSRLNLYGGNLSVTAYPGHYAIDVSELGVYGGTLTAKAEGKNPIFKTTNVTTGDGMKAVKTDNQTEKADYYDPSVGSITITKCNDHIFTYSDSTASEHKATCTLCGTEITEAHKYKTYTGNYDGFGHVLACACGAESKSGHHNKYLPDSDGLTHTLRCTECDYTANSYSHEFTNGKCRYCDMVRTVILTENGKEHSFATAEEAFALASAEAYSEYTVKFLKDTLIDKKVSFANCKVTIDLGTKTIDTNFGSNFEIGENADVTIKNGKVGSPELISTYEYPAITVIGGKLTLDTVIVYAKSHANLDSLSGHYYLTAIELVGGSLETVKIVSLYGGIKSDENSTIVPLKGNTRLITSESGEDYSFNLTGLYIKDIIADGYALVNTNDMITLVPMYDASGNPLSVLTESVQTVEHASHTFENGVCACGLAVAASIGNGENTKYFSSLEEALDAAVSGDEVRLCRDLDYTSDLIIDDSDISKIINLNGKKINFSGGSRLVIGDCEIAITGYGEITDLYVQVPSMVTLYGGTYGTLEVAKSNIGALLDRGYGFKNTNGWVKDTSVTKADGVTVTISPFEISDFVFSTDPNGTTSVPSVYIGNEVYIKFTLRLDSGAEPLGGENSFLYEITRDSSYSLTPVLIEKKSSTEATVVCKYKIPENETAGTNKITIDVTYLGSRNSLSYSFELLKCPGHDFVNGVCTVCGNTCDHSDIDANSSYTCKKCGTKMIASTTIRGKVKYFDNLPSAFIETTDEGCTVKLLNDCYNLKPFTVTGGLFTLDMNGFDIRSAGTPRTITIKGSDFNIVGKGGIYAWLKLEWGRLDIKSAEDAFKTGNQDLYIMEVIAETDGAFFTVEKDKSVCVDTLTFNTEEDSETGLNIAGISLAGGRFKNIVWSGTTSAPAAGTILKKGYVYCKEDGTVLANSTSSTAQDVYVKKCEHTRISTRFCDYCGEEFEALIKDGTDLRYYKTLREAVDSLPEYDGKTSKTITVLREVLSDEDIVLDKKGVNLIGTANMINILILNRKSLIVGNGSVLTADNLYLSSLTIEDGGKALIKKHSYIKDLKLGGNLKDNFYLDNGVTCESIVIESGDCTIEDIITDYQAFRHTTSGKAWVTDAEILGGKSITWVQAADKPILNTLLAEKYGNTNVAYTPSGNKFELVTVAYISDKYNDNQVSYQWYRNGVLVAGETDRHYSPTEINTGDYTYKCVVTLDGYAVEKTISASIGKVPATVVTSPAAIDGLKYNENSQKLHTAGTVLGGTIKYGTDGTKDLSDTSAWTDAIIEATDASDSYEVYYIVKGDENHADIGPVKIENTKIGKRTVTITNKAESENGYPQTRPYYSTIPTPEKDNFNIVGSEDGASFSYKWIGEEPTDFSAELGTYNLEITVGATANTAGAKVIFPVKIVRNTLTQTTGVHVTIPNNLSEDFDTYNIDLIDGNKLLDPESFTVEDPAVAIKVRKDGNFVDYDDTSDIKIVPTKSGSNNILKVEIKGLDISEKGKAFAVIAVQASDKHFSDIEIEVYLYPAGKNEPEVTVTGDVNYTFTGSPVPAGEIKSSASYNGVNVPGTWSWVDTPPTNVSDSGSYKALFTPDVSSRFLSVEKTINVKIDPADIANADISTYGETEFTYNGKARFVGTSVGLTGGLTANDYDVTYPSDETNAGTKEIVFKGKNNFTGTKILTWTILPYTPSNVNVAFDDRAVTYDGKAKTPKVFYFTTELLGENDNVFDGMEVTYEDNINAGTGKIIVKGKGNYDFTKTLTFTINPKDISDADVVFGTDTDFVYDGSVKTVTVASVKADGLDVAFDVLNNSAKDAGEHTLVIKGKGNFCGKVEKKFNITKKNVTANVVIGGKYVYNGKEIVPTDIKVMDGNTVIPESEYTLEFKDNKDAGTATVTVKNKDGGNYVVSGSGTFVIEKAEIKVRPADAEKIYGDQVTFRLISKSNLITEAELAEITEKASFNCDGAESGARVKDGGYKISAILGATETKNLKLVVDGTGTLTVKKAALTVTVNDVTREYGAENPAITVSITGFKNGEDKNVLGGKLTLTYGSGTGKDAKVGDHVNALIASGLESDNYEIDYKYGTLTVKKIEVSASAGKSESYQLVIHLSRPITGLTEKNFIVSDGTNTITLRNVTESAGGRTYTLGGIFKIGTEYTVTIVLDGTAADETHLVVNTSVAVTPTVPAGSTGSTPSRFIVIFETNGGSKLPSISVEWNSTITAPFSPVKDGYKFAGWYADEGLKTKFDFSKRITSNTKIYAAWEKVQDEKNQIIFTIGENDALVFGSVKTNDVAPKIVNSRTMLPARFVAENLGAKVEWDGEKRIVTIKGKHLVTGKDVVIVISIGDKVATVNGKEVKLDSPAFIEKGRTYTPVRFISEELGASVEWIQAERKVIITKP